MSHHVTRTGTVLSVPFRHTTFLSRNCPDIVEWWIHFFGHARNERRAAIGLGTHRCTRGPVNVDFSVQAGTLRVAEDYGAHASILKANGSDDGIVHFDARMVVVVP